MATTLQFVNNMAPSAVAAAKAFDTKFIAPDRSSKPVKLVGLSYDKATKEIKAVGSDSKIRICKVNRLTNIEDGRQLWKDLVQYGNDGMTFQFVSAGGFSPDSWFYKIELVADEVVELNDEGTPF